MSLSLTPLPVSFGWPPIRACRRNSSPGERSGRNGLATLLMLLIVASVAPSSSSAVPLCPPGAEPDTTRGESRLTAGLGFGGGTVAIPIELRRGSTKRELGGGMLFSLGYRTEWSDVVDLGIHLWGGNFRGVSGPESWEFAHIGFGYSWYPVDEYVFLRGAFAWSFFSRDVERDPNGKEELDERYGASIVTSTGVHFPLSGSLHFGPRLDWIAMRTGSDPEIGDSHDHWALLLQFQWMPRH